MTPIRKNQVIAIEVTHTYTKVHGPTKSYKKYHLGFATECSRAGVVRKYRFAGQTHSLRVDGWARVFAITGENAPKAAALANSLTYPGRDWDSVDDLRAAILNTQPEQQAA